MTFVTKGSVWPTLRTRGGSGGWRGEGGEREGRKEREGGEKGEGGEHEEVSHRTHGFVVDVKRKEVVTKGAHHDVYTSMLSKPRTWWFVHHPLTNEMQCTSFAFWKKGDMCIASRVRLQLLFILNATPEFVCKT